MRISQIMLAKGFGGAERSFVDTALSLARRGHAVQVICHAEFSKIALLENRAGIELATVRSGSEWDFIAPRKIAALLRSFNSSIVHTQLKRAAWHGSRAAKIAGIPAVAKLHNYVDLKKYRHVHTLFCTTEDQRQHVLKSGWASERVEVIPNFSRISPVETSRDKLQKPIRILSYGRYVKKKGFDVLLRAFRKLLDSGVHARLTLGGQGEEFRNLESLVKELKLQESVELGVWLDDVTAALDQADLFILPSLDEPFGIVILEAMARGVPIISTRTKGPIEILSETTASLIEIGSVDALFAAMEVCIQDPDQTFDRAEKALERYRTHYFEAAVLPRIENVYARLTNAS